MLDPDPTQPPAQSGENNFVTKPAVQTVFDLQTQTTLGSNAMVEDSFFKRNKWFIVLTVIAFLVIGSLAYIAFRPKAVIRTAEAVIDLRVVAPSEIKTSEDGVYQISLKNNDKENLKGLRLELILPTDAKVTESINKAENAEMTLFKLPDLKSGQDYQFFVKIKLSGNSGSSQDIKAILSYQFASSNLEFKKNTQTSVFLTQSGVELEIVGPTETTQSQLVIYNLKYKNNSDKVVHGARLSLALPPGFTLESAEPEVSTKPVTWNVGDIAAKDEKEIIFQGTFSGGTTGEAKSFKAVLELPTSGTGYYAVSDTSFVTKITSFPLMVSVTPENNSSGSTADPGSTLQYVVRYQNNSSEPQQAMEVKVELLGKALDLTQVEAENALIENGLITWNASTATELEAVKAGGSGTFKFSVPVRNPPTKDSTKNLIVKVNPKISSRANPAGYPGPGLTVKINSYLRTTTSLSYQSGALPPRVGQVTTYKVTVSARTGVNDIKDGSVVFFVPLSKGSVVESSLLASIGKATFDSSISKLTWQIGQIPAFAGTFEKPATLTFTVNLTPTQTMRGREVTILKDIGVNGADMFTAKSFLGTLPNLTTSNTENAGDKGYVQ